MVSSSCSSPSRGWNRLAKGEAAVEETLGVVNDTTIVLVTVGLLGVDVYGGR